MKLLRLSGWMLLILLLTALSTLLALWLWMGSAGSLAFTLERLAPLLPAGQTLNLQDVSGSLRHGGKIAQLHWQQGNLSVQAQDISLVWRPAELLQRRLHISQLHIGRLTITNQGAKSGGTAFVLPADLRLPLAVDAMLQVGQLQWLGADSDGVEQLALHYVFDGQLHCIEGAKAQLGWHKLNFSARLQAQAPQALALQAQALLAPELLAGVKSPPLQAQASLDGQLFGVQAQLALQAKVKTEIADATPGAGPAATELTLSADIAPWQAQKIIRAQSRWQALDLAMLGPKLPHTQLSGSAQIRPQGPGWQASIEMNNDAAGPWDQKQLPLQQLKTDLHYQTGHWQLQSLQALLGAGSITGSVQQTTVGAVSAWKGQLRLQGIQASAMDSRLQPHWGGQSLSGQISWQQQPALPAAKEGGLQFELALQADGKKTPASTAGLHWQSLQAQGNWAAPFLSLNTLRLQALSAQLQGHGQINTSSWASQGQLQLQLPGARAMFGGRLAPSDGQGQLQLDLDDAAQTNQWLATLPFVGNWFGTGRWQGAAKLVANWQGGWQQQAQSLQLKASLSAPQLNWLPASGATDAATLAVQQARIDVSGRLGNWQLDSQGQLRRGEQHLNWQLGFNGQRRSDASWQLQFKQLGLAWRQGTQATPWQLALARPAAIAAEPLTLSLALTGRRSLSLSAGALQLTGPMPGVGLVSWQPSSWLQADQSSATGSRLAQWRSQGRIEGLPLAWLAALAPYTTTDLNLRGDLLLAGSWQAEQNQSMRVQARLERSSGDLQLLSPDGRNAGLSAGLEQASLQLDLEHEKLKATLDWRSQRAGTVQATLATELKLDASGWQWPQQAPLLGSVRLQQLPAASWSVLLPPGWRLSGVASGQIELGGSRAQPQWQGHLLASDLGLRSVVDGIDLSRGILQARLQGQRIEIQRFILYGTDTPDKPATGGSFDASGELVWLPNSASAGLIENIHMALTGRFNALRASIRPDRRLVLSGPVQAGLKDGQLSLRGDLRADSALITLPKDSAPSLDADVRIHRPQAQPSVASAAPAPGARPRRISPDILLALDLGSDFQIRGRGLQARLVGKLDLNLAAKPALNGSIQTVDGSYEAYGQRLQIEHGQLIFYGPLDNPVLTILAIRPQLSQRVGVQVSGTALAPVVNLYSEPNLSDVETLSWLVLGRAAGGGGVEAAMLQQAALTLLGGNGGSAPASLAKAFGLDEFSVGATSETGQKSSALSVTLGKRLSQDFYISYESGLGAGMFSIFYDLSQYLTLRATTGEASTVDLIWSKSYD